MSFTLYKLATKKTYLRCIPLCFGVYLMFHGIFRFNCITTVTPFIRQSQGWSLRSDRVLDQSQQKCLFFRNLNPLQFFSALAQEGNLPFLSERSARKKLQHFSFKLNCCVRLQGPIWLSSSACGRLCANQLICF